LPISDDGCDSHQNNDAEDDVDQVI
jgi:hypothetical protein